MHTLPLKPSLAPVLGGIWSLLRDIGLDASPSVLAEYKDLEALMAACANKWVNKEDHLSCKSILDGAGNSKITGAACDKQGLCALSPTLLIQT